MTDAERRKGPNGLIYLSSPYSAKPGHVRALRAKQVRRALMLLAQQGEVVFSPVAYGYPIEEALAVEGYGRPSREYWMRMCLPILTVAPRVYVLTLDGWERSAGLREEVCYAARLGKPIIGYSPFDGEAEEISGSDIKRICQRPIGELDVPGAYGAQPGNAGSAGID